MTKTWLLINGDCNMAFTEGWGNEHNVYENQKNGDL